MDKNELVSACVNSIKLGLPKPVITLVIKGARKTIAGKGSPRGQVVETRKDENVIAFDAIDVLAYLVAHGRAVADSRAEVTTWANKTK